MSLPEIFQENLNNLTLVHDLGNSYHSQISFIDKKEALYILRTVSSQTQWMPDYTDLLTDLSMSARSREVDGRLIHWIRFFDAAEEGLRLAEKTIREHIITGDYDSICAFNDFCMHSGIRADAEILPVLLPARRAFYRLMTEDGQIRYWSKREPEAWAYQPFHPDDLEMANAVVANFYGSHFYPRPAKHLPKIRP